MSEETEVTEGTENPVLETPSTEDVQPDPQESAAALLETLSKLNIESPDRLENVATSAQQVGHMQNLLGQERAKREALEAQLNAFASQRQAPRQPQQEYGYQDYDAPVQPAGMTAQQIEEAVNRAVGNAVGNYTQRQTQAQQAVLREYSEIQSDPEFSAVKSIWEKHVSNPRVQMAIQSNETTLKDEFARTKLAFYKGIAQQSKQTIEGFLTRQPNRATPPHMEQGTVPMPGVAQPATNLDNLREAADRSQGTDDDLEAMLKSVLPDGDMFLQPPEETREGRIRR